MLKKYHLDDLLKECKKILADKGHEALLYRNIDKKLYFRLYQNKVTLKELYRILGIENEIVTLKENTPYKYGTTTRERWTWKRVIEYLRPIVEKENFLPPAAWLTANGHQSVIQATYNLGKSWDDVRQEFNSYQSSSFVKSRNNMRWRSHPEASFSNFLYARAINHSKGSKYPSDFQKLTGQSYGYYDIEFIDQRGNKIQVEIWGDKPYGHNQEHYQYKRNLKESYNKGNKCFLGVHFNDAYNEKRLEKILQPFIGLIKPFHFQESYDKEIPSTHWSNADELIHFCKHLANSMPDKSFPTEEWLRKRGKWKNRPGESYNTLSIYIKKWVGGVRKLRIILGQPENSTTKWDKEMVITEFKKFHEKYNCTPNSFRAKSKRGLIKSSTEEIKWAANLAHAVNKYFGSTELMTEHLGIKPNRRLNK